MIGVDLAVAYLVVRDLFLLLGTVGFEHESDEREGGRGEQRGRGGCLDWMLEDASQL
jgi:hypothetical protein